MSTEGGGTVMLVPAALVVAPAMVVVGAIAGTGYLIVRSAMYCGKKLDENYKARCQTWTDAQLANYQADRANRVDTKALVAATLAQIAASRANVANVQTSLDELTRTRFETEIDTALARLRGAVDSATQPSPTASADIRALKAQVRVELEGSERLPASARSAIEAARAALRSEDVDTRTLRSALANLRAAWTAETQTAVIVSHNRAAAEAALNDIAAQIVTLRTLVEQQRLAANAPIVSRLSDAEADLATARGRLATDPARAREEATKIASTVAEVGESLAGLVVAEWDRARRDALILVGQLDGLANILLDARNAAMLESSALAPVERDLEVLRAETGPLLAGGSVQAAPARSASYDNLRRRVEDLKQRVFMLVSGAQHAAIGSTIADVMSETGFTREHGSGEPPRVEKHPDGRVIVTGVKNGATPGFKSDEQLVSFTISPTGDIHYDFSGYAGSACVSDAQILFGKLRDRGVVLLDLDQTQQLDMARATPEELIAMPLPHTSVNKRQTELRERMRQAFARLGYRDVQESVYGGTVQFDGRNGPLGYYHVALDASGNMDVYKDRVDVSGNLEDPLIRESKSVELPRIFAPMPASHTEEQAPTPPHRPLGQIGQ